MTPVERKMHGNSLVSALREGSSLRPIQTAIGASRHPAGFTLVEILVVLVVIALLAGMTLPRLYSMSRRYEIAAQREAILSEIANLNYRAYSTGQAIELPARNDNTDAYPFPIPQGWRLEIPQAIRYNFNGICNGGRIILVDPDNQREDLQLVPPLCRLNSGTSDQ